MLALRWFVRFGSPPFSVSDPVRGYAPSFISLFSYFKSGFAQYFFLALIVAMSAFAGDFILNLSSTLVLLLENVVFMEDAHNLIGFCP